jgi:hypothetical protein
LIESQIDHEQLCAFEHVDSANIRAQHLELGDGAVAQKYSVLTPMGAACVGE